MATLTDLAHAIDGASDAGDEALLRKLDDDCERMLETAEGGERVLLRYYQSNANAGIIMSRQRDSEHLWSWEQPEGIRNILLLRQAIGEPAFKTIHPITACQIRTNLANRLNALGRPIAANEQWLKVLEIHPRFAKALANRAKGLTDYAGALYDRGHTPVMLVAARSLFDAALGNDAFWESEDGDSIKPVLAEQRKQIADFLSQIEYNDEFDLNHWPLGTTEEERSYRRWCLRERLFLNPLNDAYTDSVAATDVLHLPDHAYRLEEAPRFPAYFNLLKQEYVSARYRLYRAIHEDDRVLVMRDVLMLDSGEGQALGHYTEELRSAYRSSYAIFDKVGLFLNDYFEIGLKPRDVTFRDVWSEKPNRAAMDIRPKFKGRPNWALRGLYCLSTDLFDQAFKEVAEPDAANLAQLRQQVEHRFLSFQHSVIQESTETHRFASVEEFTNNTLRLMKMAREALIYLSLAMHREEELREEQTKKDSKVGMPVISTPIESFRRY